MKSRTKSDHSSLSEITSQKTDRKQLNKKKGSSIHIIIIIFHHQNKVGGGSGENCCKELFDEDTERNARISFQ